MKHQKAAAAQRNRWPPRLDGQYEDDGQDKAPVIPKLIKHAKGSLHPSPAMFAWMTRRIMPLSTNSHEVDYLAESNLPESRVIGN